MPACRRLEKKVKHPNCRLVKAYSSIDSYQEEVDKCDLFIGQKLHSTVFATMGRIPSIMLGYRPKCLDYMKSINMGKYHIRTDELTSKLLISKFTELHSNHVKISKDLDKQIMHYKVLQTKRAEEIKKAIIYKNWENFWKLCLYVIDNHPEFIQ